MRLLALLAAGLLAGTLVAADPVKFDPKAEMEKLRGEWRTEKDAKVPITLNFLNPGISLTAKPSGKSLQFTFGIDDAFELKQDGGKTAIVLGEALSKLSDVPRGIGYSFDKESLVLTIGEGDLKGEHRLTRAAKKDK